MSTNPFRRSSLKGSSGSDTHIYSSAPIDISDDGGHQGSPLSVNTKAISTQKHVNFASPPAVPISPASYPPSSPESTRFSPVFTISKPALPAKTDYSAAIQADPYRVGVETDENDGAIEQAMYNARVNNSNMIVPPQEPEREDAVKKTLSKFASTPRRAAKVDNHKSTAQQMAAPVRQSMDVDSFKRMLLTGDSGIAQNDTTPAPIASVTAPRTPSENSSSMETASSSQRSVHDYSRSTTEGSSRSSENSDVLGYTMPTLDIPEEKKKPPPPPSRHGKLIKDHSLPSIPSTGSISPSTQASPELSATTSETAEPQRLPPPPPMSRRRSQNSGISRSNTPQQPLAGEPTVSRTPPPPPTRRPGSMIERRTSTDLPPTMEESDTIDISGPPNRKTSDSRPPLPPSRNSSASKGMNLLAPSTTAAPPLPPPRRARGSSRSSIDSQRPSISASTNMGAAGSTRSSNEFSRSGMDSRKVSAASDILANLAALQKEVDEARRGAGH